MKKKTKRTKQEIEMNEAKREMLRGAFAAVSGGCSLQDGWPCGTCLLAALEELGLKEDGEHNEPVDRTNEFWRGILQIRGG